MRRRAGCRRTASACRRDGRSARRPCRPRRGRARGRGRSRSGWAGRRRPKGRSGPWRGCRGRARSTPPPWSGRHRSGRSRACPVRVLVGLVDMAIAPDARPRRCLSPTCCDANMCLASFAVSPDSACPRRQASQHGAEASDCAEIAAQPGSWQAVPQALRSAATIAMALRYRNNGMRKLTPARRSGRWRCRR